MSTILNKKYRYLRHYASLFMFAFTFWLSIFCVKNNDVFGSNKLNPIGTDPDPQQVLQCNQWWRKIGQKILVQKFSETYIFAKIPVVVNIVTFLQKTKHCARFFVLVKIRTGYSKCIS